ncbi:common central domain of tyrosinase-domain-containing protein [Fusarium tricinctum]|uniref:tyrosinase n=1 Tax=Fusarium tricinctum TaxID=61284 RepID=A0A8K0RNQ8_9HYPO|nr:common central domain of tyrosinase-domain-containing protein [Fusarium tricinctum]
MNNTALDQLNKAHGKGVVLGLADFGVAQRVDIDVMLTEQPDTFNLYLIAMMELQGMKDLPWQDLIPDDFSFEDGKQLDLKMSWFQLTGIHGLPLSPWDGEGEKGWYCTHSKPNFGTWHRPYLAMMEQTLFRQVANVAKRFSESNIPDEQKKKYLAAAQQFRIPYWDYYRPRAYTKPTFPGVTNPNDGTTTAPFDWGAPQIFTLPEVMVRRLPDNKLISMPNPFFQFKFNPEQFNKLDPSTQIPQQLVNIEQTIRHGGSDAAATKSMNNRLNTVREDQIRLCLALIEDKVYRNFRTFSTNAVLPKANEQPEANLEKASGSIEDFHGKYHAIIGGTGHMSFISTAAFDPIFWMHHCQIDRLFAIWQAANGDAHWFNELEPEDQEMGKLDLTPFRKWTPGDRVDAKKQYWNSDLARKTADFGYIYPELADGQAGDTIRKGFAEKYEWSRRTTAKPIFGTPPDDMRPIQVGDAQVFQYTSDTSSGDLLKHPGFPVHEMQQQTVMAAMTSNPQYADDWYIDVVVERMFANGSYTIFYIIGDVQGESGEEWSSLPGFVGMSHILAAPSNVCENCARQDEQRQLVTSTTPITSLLLDYAQIGELSSMEEDDVKQFLIKNLKWRVQTVAGEVLDPREMARNHDFNLSISRKRTPVPRSAGDVQYDTYPDVIEAIIRNSS